MEALLYHKLIGFILGGACTWTGLFSEFYGIQQRGIAQHFHYLITIHS